MAGGVGRGVYTRSSGAGFLGAQQADKRAPAARPPRVVFGSAAAPYLKTHHARTTGGAMCPLKTPAFRRGKMLIWSTGWLRSGSRYCTFGTPTGARATDGHRRATQLQAIVALDRTFGCVSYHPKIAPPANFYQLRDTIEGLTSVRTLFSPRSLETVFVRGFQP